MTNFFRKFTHRPAELYALFALVKICAIEIFAVIINPTVQS